MNLVGVGLLLGVLVVAAAGSRCRCCRLGRGDAPVSSGCATALAACGGVLAGVAALAGRRVVGDVPQLLPLTGLLVAVDPLVGVFVRGDRWGRGRGRGVQHRVLGYTPARPGLGRGRRRRLLPLFVAAMLLVPAAGSVTHVPGAAGS